METEERGSKEDATVRSRRVRIRTRWGNVSVHLKQSFRLGIHTQYSISQLSATGRPPIPPEVLEEMEKMGIAPPEPIIQSKQRVKWRSILLGPIELRLEVRQ